MDERLLLVVEMESHRIICLLYKGVERKGHLLYIRRPLQLLLDAGIHFIFINGHNMIMV